METKLLLKAIVLFGLILLFPMNVFGMQELSDPDTVTSKETCIAEREVDDIDDSELVTVVEIYPEFPGGKRALMQFLKNNVRYPKKAVKKGIEGRVICQFTVSIDGSISEITVLRGVHRLLDREAVRVIKLMPKWKPGEQRGKKVATKFTIPISFKL